MDKQTKKYHSWFKQYSRKRLVRLAGSHNIEKILLTNKENNLFDKGTYKDFVKHCSNIPRKLKKHILSGN